MENMEAKQMETLQITSSPRSKGKTEILVTLGDDVIHRDVIDPARQRDREKFAQDFDRLKERYPNLEVEPAEIDERLLNLHNDQSGGGRDTEHEPSSEELLERMPSDVKQAAEQFLRSPDLLNELKSDFETIGICGEDVLATMVYLIGTSRMLPKPLAGIVQGSSSTGKSFVLDRVASLFPEETIVHATQMTPQALFYMKPGSLRHKFVGAGERSRAEGDENADATRALREMLSGARLSKLVTMKVDGQLKTSHIVQEGPIAYVESTTVDRIFDEDLNRCILLHTNESEQQTAEVLAFLARRCSGQSAPDSTAVAAKHHAVQRMLRVCDVIIPYAECVAAMMGRDRVESRRAFPLLMSCVMASALLHQCQRKTDGQGRLVASAEDYELAYQLMQRSLQETLGGHVSESTLRFLDWLQTTFGSREFSIPECERAGKAYNTAKRHVFSLVRVGSVTLVSRSMGSEPARYRINAQAQPETSDKVVPFTEDVMTCFAQRQGGNGDVTR